MTTSLMVMLGCLFLTSYTMAIYLPWAPPVYVRDAGGDVDVAKVKEALDAAKVKVDNEVPFELRKPLGDLLTAVGKQLDKDQDDKTVKAVVRQDHHQDSQDNKYNGDRRRFDLRGGWSLGLGGLKWQSQNGRTTFTLKPTFHGFKPNGVHAGVVFHF